MKHNLFKNRVRIITKTATLFLFSLAQANQHQQHPIDQCHHVYRLFEQNFNKICNGEKGGFNGFLEIKEIPFTPDSSCELNMEIKNLVDFMNSLVRQIQTIMRKYTNKGPKYVLDLVQEISSNFNPELIINALQHKLQKLLIDSKTTNDSALTEKIQIILRDVHHINIRWNEVLKNKSQILIGLQKAMR